MSQTEPSRLSTAMANADRELSRPSPTATDPYAAQRAREIEAKRNSAIEKIKHRPTERLTAYARGAEKLIEDAREELISMEAEHGLIIDQIATDGQDKINAKRKELETYEAEVKRCKEELSELEEAGKAQIEQAVAEYDRQRKAQEAIIRAQLALRDSLNPAIVPSDRTFES